VQSVSRDFINTRAADDAYNSEQFSFTRGPNSILFGIGNPGGIMNSISKRAKFIDASQLALRADTNDSARASIDLNRVLWKNRAAIRFAAVKDESHTNRKPSDRVAHRQYGAFTAKPFAQTTVRIHGEHGRLNSLNVRPWAASDGLSAWIAAGSPEIPANMDGGGATYANLPSDPAGRPTRAANLAVLTAAGFEIQNPSPVAMVVDNSASPLPVLTQMGFITTGRPALPGGDRVPTLLNSPIPYTANVLGYGNSLVQHLATYSIALEQKVGENLFIEAVYNRQRTNNWNNYSSGNQDNIYQDRQRNLLTWDNRILPNPNYGRYFVSNIAVTSLRTDYLDQTARVTASYTLDLKGKLAGRLSRFLGHHNFAALGEQVSSQYVQDDSRLGNTTPEAVKSTPRWPAANATNIQASQNGLGRVNYLTVGDESTYAMRNFLFSYPRIILDGSPLPAASPDGVTPAFIATRSTRSIQEIESRMLVSQNFFLDDRIVTTFGVRRDRSDLWLLPTQNNPANRNFTIDARTRDVKGTIKPFSREGSTYTQGVVVTPLRWVGLFYNQSTSFIPPAAVVDIYGDPLPNGRGKGQDYGVKLSFLDGRVNASLSRYSTDYLSVPSTVLRSGATNLSAPRLAIISAMNNSTLGGPGGPMWDGSHPQWAGSAIVLNGINDVSSRGYEISVNANILRSWRLTANFSHQITKTSNFGAKEAQWVEEVAYGYFNANPQYLGILTGAGLQNNNETIRQRLEDMRTILSLARTLSGKADARQPQYSANFVSGYDFDEGPFKGIGVGATYRWRQKPILGYAFVPGRTDLFDTNQIFYGDQTHVVGAFASYRFRLRTTRVRLQLNVNGLNNDHGLHPYSAVDAGNGTRRISRYSVGPGRNFALSTTFDF
jgi:outer membrane receptor protein involved in Fe transport